MLPNSTYQGRLTVALADTVPSYRAAQQQVVVQVDIALVPPSWPYWLGGFVLLATALAAAALGRRWLRGRRLFGQLEAWPNDRPAQVARYSDLSTFGLRATLGSAGISLPGVTSILATLHVGSIDGEQLVIVRPNSPERLTMAGRTQAELALFNGDSFELGGWTFRYRGETGRRRAS
jgi:hypothetical protein